MVTAGAMQAAIILVTAVKMFFVLQVIQSLQLLTIISVCMYIYIQSHANAEPRTCEDIGITECCTDTKGVGVCDVFFGDSQNLNSGCSCNMSCHERNDCCTDAEAIGCIREFSSIDIHAI